MTVLSSFKMQNAKCKARVMRAKCVHSIVAFNSRLLNESQQHSESQDSALWKNKCMNYQANEYRMFPQLNWYVYFVRFWGSFGTDISQKHHEVEANHSISRSSIYQPTIQSPNHPTPAQLSIVTPTGHSTKQASCKPQIAIIELPQIPPHPHISL